MEYVRRGYFVSTNQRRFDFEFVCESLHSTRWAKDRPNATIVASFRNSLCFGLFSTATRRQIGFVRVVTDKVVASVIDDVFVDARYRGKGLGTWLMTCVMSHPHVYRTKCRLKTADAHEFYKKFGFTRGAAMERRPGMPIAKPNKAPEPTPTSVTSPAGAGAAPAAVVAHL